MGQGVIPGVCAGWPGANGASAGSRKGVSNISRIGFRNGKVQEGSFPAFCTLLGINLSGKAAAISEPTCKIVTPIARTTSKRYPFKLRNRNLTNIDVSRFSFDKHAAGLSSVAASSLCCGLEQPISTSRLYPVRIIFENSQNRPAPNGDRQEHLLRLFVN